MTVTVNNVRGTCDLSADCSYEIDRDSTQTPVIQSFTVGSDGLSININDPCEIGYGAADITVNFAGSPCTSITFSSSTITCLIEKNIDNSLKLVAGSHKPKVHIKNIGNDYIYIA